MARLRDASFDVKGEAGVDFGGDAARDDFEDFKAEIRQTPCRGQSLCPIAIADHFVDEGAVLGVLAGSVDEGGVGGKISR